MTQLVAQFTDFTAPWNALNYVLHLTGYGFYDAVKWIATMIADALQAGLWLLLPPGGLVTSGRELWTFIVDGMFGAPSSGGILDALPDAIQHYFDSADGFWYGELMLVVCSVVYQLVAVVVDPRLGTACFTLLILALFVSLFIRLVRFIETAIWGSA